VTVTRVGVVGAGTMGAGIAQIAALGEYETRLHDPVPEALEAGLERLRGDLAKGAEKGRWSGEDAAAARDRVAAAPALADLGGCDLIVEAAPEDLALKRELFAALADACGPGAILATNTSSLPVAEIGAEVAHPERVVGMHFFNPPPLMRLVEVVATQHSSEAALEATTGAARRMGRTPIRAKDSPGFVANRLARPFSLESLRMLEQGVADAATIDRVIRLGGGFRMGPFELLDLIGLDVNLGVARSFYRQGGEPERWRPSEIQMALVGEGRLGRKSGVGFYIYDEAATPASGAPFPPHRWERRTGRDGAAGTDGVEAPTLDAEELARIDPVAPEVLPRLVAQIANEAAFAREEEIASPEDMDTAMRLGFNWPRGPLELTALIGPTRAVELLEALRERNGDAYRPAPLLAREAEEEKR
jgi:3-hydroxybutyryl-CoA dehydrogenase